MVRQCTVVRERSGMYLIRIKNGGGIQVKAHRLFNSLEEAEESVPRNKGEGTAQTRTGYRSPYDYWY